MSNKVFLQKIFTGQQRGDISWLQKPETLENDILCMHEFLSNRGI